VALGVTALAVRVVGDSGLPWDLLAVSLLLLPLGAAAGASVRARRHSGRLLDAGAEALALSAVLVLGLGVLTLVLGRLPDRREQDLVVPAAAGLAVGALAHPWLRRRISGAVARRTAPGVRTPAAVLDAFGERRARAVPLEELLLQLAEALRADLALTGVDVWTAGGGSLQRLLSVPHRTCRVTTLDPDQVRVLRRAGVAGEAWLRMWLPALLEGREDVQVRLAPVGYGGDLLGLLLVTRRRDGERFGERDERALGEVARRLALTLHNRSLDAALQATLDDLRTTNDELRASRSRLVAAADAERRRIERDIHDGAQQHLVALAVNLGLSRQLLREDPDAAVELLDEVAVDLKETIAQVRDLAHGVYPPLLREAGLSEALRAAAARSPLAVTVDVGELRRYGADLEAAVYFCCLEALQNAAKHAPDAAVVLTAREEPGSLRVMVTDDGPGFDVAAVRDGQGLQNMTDRVGAVGGVLTLSAAPGAGTRVEAVLPLASEAATTPAGAGA
jgi:signal transduction histidine kinase